MNACPDENALTLFARGDEGPARVAMEAHLDGCEACRRAVAAAASESTLPATVPATALTAGMRVARYEIERELGRGGMGVVYLARDVTLDRRIALKLLHARHDEAAQARLLREAQVMARLAHPNVVPVFELGDWRGELYLTMELVNGDTLEAWLKAQRREKPEVLQKFIEAGRGLAAAHAAGVVHRDFKPANVLVGLDGRVRVTDFGLSRPGPASAQALPPLASPLVTREGVLVGTLAYMSPEQLDGKPADERSDQFSFCVALGEALTGTRPFSGENWSDLAISQAAAPTLRTVDRRLREVLRRGLQRDPSRRFTSMAALLAELERKPTRRPTMLAAAAAAGVAMMAAVVAVAPGVRSRLPFVGAGYKQWVPVVCAARDLPAGTLITMDMVQQRSLPPEAVSKSNITPEAVQFIVGQVVHTNVYGGDALLWSEFETVEDGQRDVMVAVNDLPVGAVLTEADVRTRRVDAALATESVVKPDSARFLVGQRLVSPLKQGDLVTWSAFETVEQGQREVLVAAEDLAEGAIVTSSNVVARKVDAALATNSVVKSDSTALVLGQRVHAQLQKGDLLLWSQFELDDPKPNQQSAVMAVVLGHKPQLEQCIQAERAAHPDGKGKVVMSWTVAPDGSVRGVGTKTPGMKGSSLVSCLSAAIATWRFPVGEVDAVIDFPFQY